MTTDSNTPAQNASSECVECGIPGISSEPQGDQQPVVQGVLTAESSAAMPGQPQDQQPYKHSVHKSYIWLGTLRTLPAVVVAIIASVGGSAFTILFDDEIGIVSHGISLNSGMVALFAIGSILLLVAALAIVVLLIHWWSYKHLYFTVTDAEFSLYQGIFNKKQVHIPYERIQSVDEVASLLQRVFGVCNVSIDTAGGSANKAVMVPYLTKSQAEWLRRELFARRAQMLSVGAEYQGAIVASPGSSETVGAANTPSRANVLDAPAQIWDDVRGAFAGCEIDTGKATYEYGLSNGELILTGFSNNTGFVLVILGVVAMLASVASTVFDIFEPSDAMVDSALQVTMSAFSQSNVLISGVVAFVVGCAVLWVLSALGTCVSYGGFKARRRGTRVEVEYGLLKHQYQGVDISRVQSVVVKQTFIRRIFGYGEISLGKIDTAADSSNNKSVSTQAAGVLVIHPFVKMDRVPEILAGMVPEFADVPKHSIPVAKVALRRGLIRNCILYGGGFWLLVVAAFVWITAAAFEQNLIEAFSVDDAFVWMVITGVAVALSALGVVLLIIEAINTLLWARESSFGYNQRFMQVTNGGLSRTSVQFPRQKIQFGYTKTNPFQRRASTATLVMFTAAGIGGTKTQLIDAARDDAQKWLSWLKPHGNVAGD